MENEREEAQLKKLEKTFSALEVEYDQIQEKRRLAEEKRKEEIRELELKTKAAILIQACWRGYITRKSLKNKGKSKKPKKPKSKTNKKKLWKVSHLIFRMCVMYVLFLIKYFLI